ncbi:MAG TPA: RNA polymerase sigma factor RpoE [Gammaproteobacteria bacterium]|nr:RNA polymerase sigma factor RpoE [Gammaproteobacteria bacterium]
MGKRNADRELVERVQDGDKSAFDLLVRKYQGKVVKLVSRYVHDPSEALDVAQEAFIKAYRALPSFRGDSAFYTWLYRISINTAKNHVVALGRQPVNSESEIGDSEHFDINNRLQEVDTPEGMALTGEIQDTVLRAIEALPEDLRTAIMLRELEGMSYEEISQAMDCPVGTVRSRLFRARESIDNQLKELLD